MVVNMLNRFSTEDQIAIQIRKSNYVPSKTNENGLVENLLLCYEYDLEKSGQNYFSKTDKRLDDILFYVKNCGGFDIFDFDLEEEINNAED